MPKRKREEGSDDGSEKGAAAIQRKQLKYKLEQGIRKLGHAVKTARGFERQKLGRRHKNATAEKDEKDVQRIETEISALKALDNALSARSYLYKSLLKIKAATQSPLLSQQLSKLPTMPSDAASLNVNARLCNSNAVKEALPSIISDVFRAAGVRVAETEIPKKRRLRAKDFEDAPAKASTSANPHDYPRLDRRSQRVVRQIGPSMGKNSSKGESEEDFAGYDDRLASSEGDTEGLGSDLDDLEQQLELEGIQQGAARSAPRAYSPTEDLSLFGSLSSRSTTTPEPVKAPAAKRAFVPSLTLGGYISGSGSDIDDDTDTAPKKNRRGQRARQAIAEMKFGAKAKHLQRKERMSGWDSKRGATDGGDRRRVRHAGPRKHVIRQNNGTQDAHSRLSGHEPHAGCDTKKMHKVDSGPLHPSWEAAKKAKEKKSTPVVFQGKKVVFD